jgi:excisionase family DNA binding protein
MENPKFMTVAEVAEIMRASKMTVYRLIHSGDLPAIAIGTKGYRIPEQAVIDYIREAYI